MKKGLRFCSATTENDAWFLTDCKLIWQLTPVLFLLVSSRETVKDAARLGELRTSLRASRHSPRNLHRRTHLMQCHIFTTRWRHKPTNCRSQIWTKLIFRAVYLFNPLHQAVADKAHWISPKKNMGLHLLLILTSIFPITLQTHDVYCS